MAMPDSYMAMWLICFISLLSTHKLPSWIPVWGGQDFDFFSPIFNLADASISTGIISILVFQKRFFKTILQK